MESRGREGGVETPLPASGPRGAQAIWPKEKTYPAPPAREITWQKTQLYRFSADAAEPYINSYVQFCGEHNQQTFKVMEASVVARMQRVPCKQALEEIFQDRFVELQNGFLKYRDA